MSKLSFRARALDATKPMPVYRAEEVPDLPDFAAINRAVPQMPTGMEKEEECEHHLQRAISAQQAFGHTGELVIPTPEVFTANEEDYENIYPGNYKMPRQLIHMQPFAMDQDIPDYDMDSEDEKWMSAQARKMEISALQFEEIMDRLEKSSGQQVVTLKEAKLLLKEDDDLVIAVYDYWLNKRLKTQHPLIPTVKTEKRDGSTNNNPYVAFRRRTEKMQTRKNRKNDEASYEKMLKLRRDLSRAVTLLEMVKRREKTKREHLHLTIEIFEKRHQAGDYSGQILAEVSALKHARSNYMSMNNKADARTTSVGGMGGGSKGGKETTTTHQKKRQYTKRKNKQQEKEKEQHHSHHHHSHRSLHSHVVPASTRIAVEPDFTLSDMLSSDEEGLSPTSNSDMEDENDPDGQYAFRRKKFCNYHAPLAGKQGSWPWCGPNEGGMADKRFRYCLTSLSLPRPRCIGFARRRIGRGGRVLVDRAYTPLDDYWTDIIDSNVATTTNNLHSLPNGIVNNSVANEFIAEVKNEWLHFRPQMSHPLESSDNLLDPDDLYDPPDLTGIGLSIAGTSAWCPPLVTNNSSSSYFKETPLTDASSITTNVTTNPPVAMTTSEQFNLSSFQHHREELFEMQRKQLERLKGVPYCGGNNTNYSANTTTTVAVPSSSDNITLDSASAQFAVSAVLTPNDVTGFLNSVLNSSPSSGGGSGLHSRHASSNKTSCNGPINQQPDSRGLWQRKTESEIFPLMMSPDSLIEITLPDGSVTSGHVHIAPSETPHQVLPVVLPSMEILANKMAVHHTNREQNGNEKSSSQEDFSLSKVKLENVQSECGFPMDVT